MQVWQCKEPIYETCYEERTEWFKRFWTLGIRQQLEISNLIVLIQVYCIKIICWTYSKEKYRVITLGAFVDVFISLLHLSNDPEHIDSSLSVCFTVFLVHPFETLSLLIIIFDIYTIYYVIHRVGVCACIRSCVCVCVHLHAHGLHMISRLLTFRLWHCELKRFRQCASSYSLLIFTFRWNAGLQLCS